MINVKYVGKKAVKSDNVANTGTVWIGYGDVHPVSEAVWGKLSKHPDIWQDADKAAPEAKADEPAGDEKPAYIIEHGGSSIDLETLGKETLKELAKTMGVDFHPNSGADKIRQAIVASKTAA